MSGTFVNLHSLSGPLKAELARLGLSGGKVSTFGGKDFGISRALKSDGTEVELPPAVASDLVHELYSLNGDKVQVYAIPALGQVAAGTAKSGKVERPQRSQFGSEIDFVRAEAQWFRQQHPRST